MLSTCHWSVTWAVPSLSQVGIPAVDADMHAGKVRASPAGCDQATAFPACASVANRMPPPTSTPRDTILKASTAGNLSVFDTQASLILASIDDRRPWQRSNQ